VPNFSTLDIFSNPRPTKIQKGILNSITFHSQRLLLLYFKSLIENKPITMLLHLIQSAFRYCCGWFFCSENLNPSLFIAKLFNYLFKEGENLEQMKTFV
jgi:hypothetical protein